MAKSGFVPAWMKIPSSDKTNGNQKLSIDRSNHSTIISGQQQRYHSSEIEQSRNKSNEQQNYFSFQFRRSFSREHLSNDNHSDMTIKTNNRFEKDLPFLNRSELSSNNNENLSRTFRSNRLLSTPTSSRPIIHELQTKNFDKRNDFLNSLKTDFTIEENKHHFNQLSKPITKKTLLLLSVPETSEEKELLIRMGWNDDMTYEITDKDKEEYEKRIKLLPKTDNRSTRLMSALNRRTLPCINIQDILQLKMIGSASDDDSSDD